jgi:hypothetical protein
MTSPVDKAWQDLEEELSLWAAQGRTATLWWRDDDAIEATPQLTRLLDLSGSTSVPLALAVVPANAQKSLATALIARPASVTALVHGFSHINLAPDSQKKAEFHEARPLAEMATEVSRALKILNAELPDHVLPVFVPPWNRLPSSLITPLAKAGYKGLSTYKARKSDYPAAGLVQNNCHADPVNWRQDSCFLGEAESLASITAHLVARRTDSMDSTEITGFLTHHLVQDTKTWNFLQKFFTWTAEQPTVHWLDAREVFKLP